jgi:hypothetical protein
MFLFHGVFKMDFSGWCSDLNILTRKLGGLQVLLWENGDYGGFHAIHVKFMLKQGVSDLFN